MHRNKIQPFRHTPRLLLLLLLLVAATVDAIDLHMPDEERAFMRSEGAKHLQVSTTMLWHRT